MAGETIEDLRKMGVVSFQLLTILLLLLEDLITWVLLLSAVTGRLAVSPQG
jgi:hypothetical protein